MGNYLLKTRITFEAAHRLYDVDTYSEECRTNLHGHSYAVVVYVGCDENLNAAGMVIDFKLLKKIIREHIEDTYDHSCILKWDDPLCEPIKSNCNKVHIVEDNPTAEWMAHQFYLELNSAIQHIDNVYIKRVEVQETEHNIAIYERS